MSSFNPLNEIDILLEQFIDQCIEFNAFVLGFVGEVAKHFGFKIHRQLVSGVRVVTLTPFGVGKIILFLHSGYKQCRRVC